ncbi:MAG: hypothetical protein ABGW87_08825 [Sphingomonadaceae bacterium]
MRRKRTGRILLTLFVLLLVGVVVLALLALGTSPTVAPQPPASQQDITAAKAIYPALSGKGAQSAPTPLTLDSGQLAGLAGMARRAGGFERVTMDIEGAGVVMRASDPLPFGLWLNTSARLSGSNGAEPGLSCSAGRLEMSGMACGWIWSVLRHTPGTGAAGLPPLDRLVKQLSARDGHLRLRLDQTDIANLSPKLKGAAVDFALAKDTYCRLALAQTSRPATSLDALLRRAFLPGIMTWDAKHNRATLVAIAVLVTGKPAFVLLPGAEAIIKECPLASDPVMLRGKPDLARHWAFSAGFTAAYGSQSARRLDDFKQSGDGSDTSNGLTFIALAASRSGVDFATRALAPATARDTAAEFSLITENELFPPSLMDAPANVRNADLTTSDGGIDAAYYAEAAAWIDRTLAELR